jgi:uncharacterized protein YgiM (DUF1202 family)
MKKPSKKITTNPSNLLSSFALQESAALKTMREMASATNLLSSFALQESAALKTMREMASATNLLSSFALQESAALKTMRELGSLSSIKALRTLENSPFNSLVTNLIVEGKKAPNASDFVDEYVLETDRNISDELSTCNDFEKLSDKTKKFLLYLYHYYLLPIVIAYYLPIIVNNAEITKEKFNTVTTGTEVRSLARNLPLHIDKNLLNGYRVTTGDNLNFRKTPSMNSSIIAKVPIGTLVEIVDKSNKSWLLVNVEIEGDIEQGWISRKYTTYFK